MNKSERCLRNYKSFSTNLQKIFTNEDNIQNWVNLNKSRKFHRVESLKHSCDAKICSLGLVLLQQSALEINENVLGPQHPNVATIWRNLATLYEIMGD